MIQPSMVPGASVFQSFSLTRVITLSIIVGLIGVMMITVSSMGIECYNANKEFKKKKGKNFSFQVFTLIIGILIVILSIIFIALRVYIKLHTKM